MYVKHFYRTLSQSWKPNCQAPTCKVPSPATASVGPSSTGQLQRWEFNKQARLCCKAELPHVFWCISDFLWLFQTTPRPSSFHWEHPKEGSGLTHNPANDEAALSALHQILTLTEPPHHLCTAPHTSVWEYLMHTFQVAGAPHQPRPFNVEIVLTAVEF